MHETPMKAYLATDAASAFKVSEAARTHPDATALIVPEGVFTFRTLDERVRGRIRELEGSLPAPGRPFLIDAKSDLDTLLTVYALLELEVPFLLLHPKLTAWERRELVSLIDSIREPLPEGAQAVLFTSGTTGLPKPAVLSREALFASAHSNAKNLSLVPGDVWLLPMSVARVGGLSIITRSLMARSAVALAGRFTARGFVEDMERTGATLVSVVPTMLSKVLHEIPSWRAPKTLRALLLGGSSAGDRLLALARSRGIPVMTTYGMTETASNVVTTPYAQRLEFSTGSGAVNADTEVKVLEGTIHVRGPMLMEGYWGREPIDKKAWFRTGDIGYFDDFGHLVVQARRSDLIITGGDNVYPAEVENVLEGIDGVREARVIGLPDEEWGAVVTALLIPEKDPVELDVLMTAMHERLSSYKLPRRLAWVRDLPVLANGKPSRDPQALAGLDLTTLHWSAWKREGGEEDGRKAPCSSSGPTHPAGCAPEAA